MTWKYNHSIQAWELYYNGDKYWVYDDDSGIRILSSYPYAITDQKFCSIDQAKKYIEDYLGITDE